MKTVVKFDENLDENTIIINCKEDSATIQKILEMIEEVSELKLDFYKRGTLYQLAVSDILFFETADGRIQAHTASEIYTVKYKLYELEELLPTHFIRISKSSIVNVDHIKSVNKNVTSSSLVEFTNTHKQVYVSRHYFKKLKENLRGKVK
jgi:DNA-binding LytR/AlgR family response regulator